MSPIIARGKISYREFVERVKAKQLERGRAFTRPDDDWQPEVYFFRAGGALFQHELPAQYFASRESKDVLARGVIPALIRAGDVTMCAVVYGMWAVRVQADTPEKIAMAERALETMEYPEEIGMPREHPDRIEIVHIHVMDAERLETWGAEIRRHPKRPPRLGPWEIDVDGWTGLMIDPIREALR